MNNYKALSKALFDTLFPEKEPRHCDEYAHMFTEPSCLAWYIFYHRLPAGIKPLVLKHTKIEEPKLWAKYNGEWISVTMASRFGDLGISYDLNAEYGYKTRVNVEDLTDFTDERPRQ